MYAFDIEQKIQKYQTDGIIDCCCCDFEIKCLFLRNSKNRKIIIKDFIRHKSANNCAPMNYKIQYTYFLRQKDLTVLQKVHQMLPQEKTQVSG